MTILTLSLIFMSLIYCFLVVWYLNLCKLDHYLNDVDDFIYCASHVYLFYKHESKIWTNWYLNLCKLDHYLNGVDDFIYCASQANVLRNLKPISLQKYPTQIDASNSNYMSIFQARYLNDLLQSCNWYYSWICPRSANYVKDTIECHLEEE